MKDLKNKEINLDVVNEDEKSEKQLVKGVAINFFTQVFIEGNSSKPLKEYKTSCPLIIDEAISSLFLSLTSEKKVMKQGKIIPVKVVTKYSVSSTEIDLDTMTVKTFLKSQDKTR